MRKSLKTISGGLAAATLLTAGGNIVGATGLPTDQIKYQDTIENLKQEDLGVDIDSAIYWKNGVSKFYKYNNNKLEEIQYPEGKIKGTEVKEGDQFLLRNVGTTKNGDNISVKITLNKLTSSREDGKNFFGLWLSSIESSVNPNKAITFSTSEDRTKAESSAGIYTFEFLNDNDLTPIELTTGGVFQLYHKALGSTFKEDLSNKKILAANKGKEFNTINSNGELVAIKDVPASVTYNNFDYTGYLGFGTAKKFTLTITDPNKANKPVDNFRLFGLYEWAKPAVTEGEKVQEKIITNYVDTENKVIKPRVVADNKSKDKIIDGYRFVEEKTISHREYTYVFEKIKEEKVITKFIESKTNKKLLDDVIGKNKSEVKTIPGYRIISEEQTGDREYTYTYEKEPVKVVTTKFVDENGKELLPEIKDKEKVNQKDIPGYTFIKEEKVSDTEYKYIYNKNKPAPIEEKNVITKFVDESGKELLPEIKDKEKVDQKDIPGYKFIKEEKVSDTEYKYIYKKDVPAPILEQKIVTKFVTEDGSEILESITSDKKIDKANIPGYKFVKEEKVSDTEYKYIYKKENISIITKFVDDNGKELLPEVKDKEKVARKDIPGYKFIKEEKVSDTEYKYIYKKEVPKEIKTIFVDQDEKEIIDAVIGFEKSKEKAIPGYKFISEEKVSDTEYKYLYKKLKDEQDLVKVITTHYVDENDKPILAKVVSEKVVNENIPGYKFIKEEKISDTEYKLIYKKADEKDKKADIKTGVDAVAKNIIPIGIAGLILIGGGLFFYKKRKQ